MNTTMDLILMGRGESKGSRPVCSIHASVTRRLLKRRCARSSSRLFADKHMLNGDSMKRNSTVSPLLSLPPEIRNRIYDLVLGGRHKKLWLAGFPTISRRPLCLEDCIIRRASNVTKGYKSGFSVFAGRSVEKLRCCRTPSTNLFSKTIGYDRSSRRLDGRRRTERLESVDICIMPSR